MKSTSSSTRIFILIVILLSLTARILPGPRTIDDAYITFRYARNILAGNGFVYNPGERVLGTTTPLYTILLVIIGLFSGGVNAQFPLIALFINAVADTIACLLLFRLGKKSGYSLAGAATAIVWSITPYSVTYAIGGLETSLYVMMLLATINAYIDFKYRLTAFLASLSFLLRPDALIFISVLFIDRIILIIKQHLATKSLKPTNNEIQELIFFLAPSFCWILFAQFYFGNPLPHSIAAKILAYHLEPNTALIRLFQHYAVPFLEDLVFGTKWIYIGMFLYPFLFLVGSRQALKKNTHLLPFILYPPLYFLVFSIANPLIFRWYLTPPLPAYILMILIGLNSILIELKIFLSNTPLPSIKKNLLTNAWRFISFCLVFLIPLAYVINGWTIHPDHGLDRPAPKMAWYQLELLYQKAANILTPQINNSGSMPILAAGDVGVLGYYTNTIILDTVGLNSPFSTTYYPLDAKYYVINYAIPPDLILDTMPDYLVILEIYGREGLLKDPRFFVNYHLITKIPTNIYGSDGLLLYELKNIY